MIQDDFFGYGVKGTVFQGKENRAKDETLRNAQEQQNKSRCYTSNANRLKTASKKGAEPGIKSNIDTE